MPQLFPIRAYYALYLYLLVRYKFLQNRLLGVYTSIHKKQILHDLEDMSEVREKIMFEKGISIPSYKS